MLATDSSSVLGTFQEKLINLPDRIIATGGIISYDGPYKIHTFSDHGQFTVYSKGDAEILLVGSGGHCDGGYYSNLGGSGGGEVKYLQDIKFYKGIYDISIGMSYFTSRSGYQGTVNDTSSHIKFTKSYPLFGGDYSHSNTIKVNPGQMSLGLVGGSSGSGYLGGTAGYAGGGGGGGDSSIGAPGVPGYPNAGGGDGGRGTNCSISGQDVSYGGGGGGSGLSPGNGFDGGGRGGIPIFSYTPGEPGEHATGGGAGGYAPVVDTQQQLISGPIIGGSGIVIIKYYWNNLDF